MRNKLERILLSILLGISVLLGLSFWLDMMFNFNLFCHNHWVELARLQTSQIPVNRGFYMSISVAVFIFVVGIYMIYRQEIKRIYNTSKTKRTAKKAKNKTLVPKSVPEPEQKQEPEPEQKSEQNTPVVSETPVVSAINMARPPRLNLPHNMAQIATNNQNHTKETPTPNTQYTTPAKKKSINPVLSDIFAQNGYLVKENPIISKFSPDLFAIGNNEVAWIGAIDCDMDTMLKSAEKLQSIFESTLEDVAININAFIVDTLNKYQPNDKLLIFKSVDELHEYINQYPADEIPESDKDSFDAYSEYIDTIIQYIKNL